MKFAVLGAGALGSIIAAHLVQHGHSVAVLARGRRAAQLERDGLKIRGLATIDAQCEVITDPNEVAAAEALIVTVKTYDTQLAIQALAQNSFQAVLSVANGVSKNEDLAQHFGKEHVLGCMANTSGELQDDGTVLFTRNVCLHIGELDGASSSRAQAIVHALDESGVVTRLEDDINSVEWSKYIAWTALLALSVTTRLKTPQFLANSHCANLAVSMIQEMGAIAASRDVTIIDQAPVPVATIIDASRDQACRSLMEIGEDWKRTAPDHRMSSLQDLERGKRLEIDETLGYAIALGHAANVPTPHLSLFYELLSAINDELMAH